MQICWTASLCLMQWIRSCALMDTFFALLSPVGQGKRNCLLSIMRQAAPHFTRVSIPLGLFNTIFMSEQLACFILLVLHCPTLAWNSWFCENPKMHSWLYWCPREQDVCLEIRSVCSRHTICYFLEPYIQSRRMPPWDPDVQSWLHAHQSLNSCSSNAVIIWSSNAISSKYVANQITIL